MLLAQFNAPGNFLERSQSLASATYEAWETIWDSFFDTTVPGLWTGMVALALLIAGLAFIYFAFAWFPNVINTETFGIKPLIQPAILFIFVAVFLTNDGFFLSQTLGFVRAIGLQLVTLPLGIQLAGIQLQEALNTVAVEGATGDEIRALISNCRGAVGEEFLTCLEEAVAEAQNVVAAVQAQNSNVDLTETGNRLNDVMQASQQPEGIIGAIDDFFLDRSLDLLQVIAYALQWAFVNGLEIVLLGVFALTPVVIAFLFTPLGPKLFYDWIVKIFGLYTTQLLYNIITGLVALVVQTGDFTRISGIRDIALAVFLGIVGPAIALIFGYGEFVKAFEQSLNTGGQLGQLSAQGTAATARGGFRLGRSVTRRLIR